MEGPFRLYGLLSLLRATPSLESFEVECIPTTPTTPPLLGMHVDLPRLQLLWVKADADECALLLTCLHLPALASLRLTARKTQMHYPILLPLLAQTLARLPAPRLLTVSGFGANPAAPGPLRLTGRQQGARISQATFDIVLGGCTDHASAVHDALQHVALDRVRALYVSGARLTRRDWHALAWPLDGATLLIVHGLYASALLPKLLRVKRLVHPPPLDPDNPSVLPRGMLRRPATVTAPPADSDSGDDAEAAPPRWGRVVLPNLMELWLVDPCMSRKEEYDAGVPGPWAEALCTALRRRADVAGAGLRTVNLLHPYNANKALLAALEDAVGSKGKVLTVGTHEPSVCEAADWAAFMEER